ncbi:MAG TPA: M50 family metallopeptidase [Streptosporangiaceae bacterium]|nr:M50 family metallopeptidase [Streptosporangiaceae bacterium]
MSLTPATLSGSAAMVTGLVAFAAVATDAGWQFIRHGTVMAHEGAHAVFVSLLFRRFDGIDLNADATGETHRKVTGGCLGEVVLFFVGYVGPSLFGLGAARLIQRGPDSGDGANLKRLTGVPRLIWFLIWLAATLGAVAVGGKMLVMPT